MADEDENLNGINTTMDEKTEEVFLNGNKPVDVDVSDNENQNKSSVSSENGKCNSESGGTSDTVEVLPRRSSLMNRRRDTDGSRRDYREKKRVSFIPTEKKISTGKHL